MASHQGPPYFGVHWLDEYHYEDVPESTEIISLSIAQIDRWLRFNARRTLLDTPLIVALHRHAFGGVFPELAGVIRGPAPDYYPFENGFGRYAGAPFADVPALMAELGVQSAHLIQQLDALRLASDVPDFLGDVYGAAAFVHCRLIEIHPFGNGNGRLARFCVNYFLRRYGLWQIPITLTDESAYLAGNQAWLEHHTVHGFVEFLRSASKLR